VASEVMVNSEDFTLFKDGIVFASSGDLYSLFNTGLANAVDGAIFAIDLNSGEAHSIEPPKLLQIEGFPEGKRFQPHGIFFSNRTSRLYTVSHPFQGK